MTWGVIQYHFGSSNGLFSAVVEAGFVELTSAMDALRLPSGATRDRVRALVETAWAAFSSPTSRASMEILIATRTGRDLATAGQLADMAKSLRRLETSLGGSNSEAVGDLIWAFLRGMVMEQMVVDGAFDSERQRALLVDVLTSYVECAA